MLSRNQFNDTKIILGTPLNMTILYMLHIFPELIVVEMHVHIEMKLNPVYFKSAHFPGVDTFHKNSQKTHKI